MKILKCDGFTLQKRKPRILHQVSHVTKVKQNDIALLVSLLDLKDSEKKFYSKVLGQTAFKTARNMIEKAREKTEVQ